MVLLKKDPYDITYFRMDLSDWLKTGETVTEQDVGDATGLTVDGKTITDGIYVDARLTGGALTDRHYDVPYRWATSEGRRKKVTLRVLMKEN